VPTVIDRSLSLHQHTLASTRFEVESLTDIHKADILTTQQWLRFVFWQPSVRQGLLSSMAGEEALGYQFPCRIAESLRRVLETLPRKALAVHGIAILSLLVNRAFLLPFLSFSCSLSKRKAIMLIY
jgi:hypothetical protein